MSIHVKLFLSIFLLLSGYAVYILTSDEIGIFEKVRARGEINQSVQVFVDHSKGFERDQYNNIIAFYIRDAQNAVAKATLKEPAPEAVTSAEIVELFGHMHGDTFVALRVSIVK